MHVVYITLATACGIMVAVPFTLFVLWPICKRVPGLRWLVTETKCEPPRTTCSPQQQRRIDEAEELITRSQTKAERQLEARR